MTDEEIDALTLGDVRRIVERATAASASLKELRGLFGAPAPVPAPAPIQAQPPAQWPPLPERPPSNPAHDEWLATQKAQREQLLAQNRSVDPNDFPPDIAEAMKAS